MKEIHELENNEDMEEKKQNFWIDLPKKMRINFIVLCVVGSLLSLGLSVQGYMPMIGEIVGITVQNIYNLFSTSVIITAVFSLIGGLIIDKCNQKYLYIIYTMVCLFSISILLIRSPIVYVISLILLGLKGVFDNVEQTYFFKAYREFEMERLWAINSILQMILSIIAPIIFGYLYDIDNNLMIGIGTLLIILAFAISFNILDLAKYKQIQEAKKE
jgi:MFS family permease